MGEGVSGVQVRVVWLRPCSRPGDRVKVRGSEGEECWRREAEACLWGREEEA